MMRSSATDVKSEGLVLRAATRRSPLALWQAEHVAGLLVAAHRGLLVQSVALETEGDQRQDLPISAIGGKGAFSVEIQRAVLDGRADFAVHSAKDLPPVAAAGLVVACIPLRGDPRDALVGSTIEQLPHQATVATGSQRRRAQLAHIRPDLKFVELRGNMATRLAKTPRGGAIVVAAAAFGRLGLDRHLTQIFDVEVMIPQVGQGAIAIECRADDQQTRDLLAVIEDEASRRCVNAERAFLAELGGDCELPAGAHAQLCGDNDIVLSAMLAKDGTASGRLERHSITGSDPALLGRTAALHLNHAISIA
jgi:hydroxymethylbilane synthase